MAQGFVVAFVVVPVLEVAHYLRHLSAAMLVSLLWKARQMPSYGFDMGNPG